MRLYSYLMREIHTRERGRLSSYPGEKSTTFLKCLASKAYPTDKEASLVAGALVTKHPCLKEPGSQTGWYGWKNSLKFKMGNYRIKLSLAVNSGRRSRNNLEPCGTL